MRDQTVLSGHQTRIDDLDAFKSLGLKALRYPFLWERIEPERGKFDWRWSDQRAARLLDLDLKVIAGLCHHGAGPSFVDLTSEAFATGLSDHAARVAERFPWIKDWTPVNEPVTTARFSALYGHWHPHLRDERSFWRVLLNEIDAVRLSMRAIRRIIPEARLIQTDDLGRTYATPELAEQAAFDNTRRWMGWDLLFGRVTPEHPFWRRISAFGFQARLEAIAAEPSPPDVIGINHYLTSDRFLDHRIDAYPAVQAGGNGRQTYVDVEAVRVLEPGPAGFLGAIEEAWERYRTPIAVTEVHNASTRDEQVRWFVEAWSAALSARAQGMDVRAVTAWSLLGAYDWDSLLTQERGHYEAGAFDVSSGARRPTALARCLRAVARNQEAPVAGQGWWERRVRFCHPPVIVERNDGGRRPAPVRGDTARILIAGATGTLGQALARACAWRDLPYILTDRRQMALDDKASIEAMLAAARPMAVFNATGFVRIDDAEVEEEACRASNTGAAVRLAQLCAARNIPSVTFSSDLVFDGASVSPYTEDDVINPLNVYGASKAEAERAITALGRGALVLRTAAFFSPRDTHNFAAWVVRELRARRPIECAVDAIVSPTYVPQLADAVLDLVLDGEDGIWHLANEGAVSWSAFAAMIAKSKGLDCTWIVGRPREELPWRAKRPAYSALASTRGRLIGDLDEAVWRFAREEESQPL